MRAAFDRTCRVLCCHDCNEQVVVPLEGGRLTCENCGQSASYAPLDESAEKAVADVPAASEAVRFDALREQDGKPLVAPKYIADLRGDAQGLQAVVHTLRAEAMQGSFPAQRELYLALMIFVGAVSVDENPWLVRRLLESSLEVMTEPRFRHVVRAQLARSAVAAGNLEAAQAWLDPVPQYSDDLYVHSAYQASAATIDTARGDFEGVLARLGRRLDAVPIADMLDESVELLRANAMERTGDVDGAEAHLVAAMARSGGNVALFRRLRDDRAYLDLCPMSFDRAVAKGPSKHTFSGGKWAIIAGVQGIMFLVLPLMLCLPGVFLRGCAPEAMQSAMGSVQECPAAMDILGADPHPVVGLGCGNMETGGGHGYLSWTVPIGGELGRGSLDIMASQRGGQWSMDALTLSAGDQEIDVLRCSAEE